MIYSDDVTITHPIYVEQVAALSTAYERLRTENVELRARETRLIAQLHYAQRERDAACRERDRAHAERRAAADLAALHAEPRSAAS
jgi:hypothetical protein